MQLDGIVPVLPTPFTAEEEIDFSALASMIDFGVESGASALLTPAYGSEFYKMSDAERMALIEAVIQQGASRLPIIAQCNHGSAKVAARHAQQCERAGADVIAIALPRQFPFAEPQLLDYCRRIADSLSLPLLLQDWHPTGTTVGADFVSKLNEYCPNFRYIKLEEPGMGEKVRAIHEATSGRVGVLEGWGGLYMLELIPSGICGVMPGLALADVMVRIFRLAQAGDAVRAYNLFAQINPYLVFSLLNMEHFHHVEKALLVRRGILPHAHVRPVTVELGASSRRYLEFLVERMVALVSEEALPNVASRQAQTTT